MTTYKFNWQAIIPKEPTRKGIIDITAFTYWGAYMNAQRTIKNRYKHLSGVNVLIKRHDVEV